MQEKNQLLIRSHTKEKKKKEKNSWWSRGHCLKFVEATKEEPVRNSKSQTMGTSG